MTRLESGGPDQVELLPARVSEIVAGGLDRARGFVRRHTVRIDVPEDLPLVLADTPQLERVIANLTENAAKFSPAGSTIRIAGEQANGSVTLRVDDEGAGVPEDQLEEIFEKFYRRRNRTAVVPGTGLGLSICRRIVEAHGVRIHAE